MQRALGWISVVIGVSVSSGIALAEDQISKRVSEIARERCSACHGPSGQGSNSQFPKLSGQNSDYLVRQMFNFKSRTRKSIVMEPQLADLSGDEIGQLARYFSRETLVPNVTSDAMKIEAGRDFFLSGNVESGISACAVCHGPTARGALMLPRLAGQHAEYLELQLRRFAEHSRISDQTLMHSGASKMTDAEIHSVSYFLSGLN